MKTEIERSAAARNGGQGTARPTWAARLFQPLHLLLFLMLGLLLPTATEAATRTVAKDGTGDYTTIQAAVNAADDGDVITIGAGDYVEGVDINKSITLKGEGPQYVRIVPERSNAISIGPGGYVVSISGLTITSPLYYGLVIGARNHVVVENCIVAKCGIDGIHHYSTISLQGPDVAIRHCTIASNLRHGLHYRSDRGGPLTIENTIFYGNESRSALGGDAYQVRILGVGFYLGSFLWFGAEFAHPGEVSGQNTTLGQSGDPRFVDPERGNYILRRTSTSPARDTGRSPFFDPDGTLVDLGAYGGPGAASFWPYPQGGPIIQNLTADKNTILQGGTIKIKASATTR